MDIHWLLLVICTINLSFSPVSGAYLKKSDIKTTPASKTTVTHFGSGEFAQGLQLINPYLKSSELANISNGASCDTRKPWEHCNQYLALFSGLNVYRYTDSGSIVFLGLTDRGPNVGCEDFADEAADEEADPLWQNAVDTLVKPESIEAGTSFTVPRFSPSFFQVALEKTEGGDSKIRILESCYLKNKFGFPVGGLPNNEGLDNDPYLAVCNAKTGYKPGGLDTEDIVALPKRGLMVLSDEYSSIIVTKGFGAGDKCGQILARYVPRDSPLTEAETKYPVYKVLPTIFSERRLNRGFENVAVLPNEKTLLGMLQSPLGEDNDETEPSHIIPAIKLDITRISDPKLQGVYLYLADQAEEGATTWLNTDNEAKDLKLSGFAAAGKFLGLPDNYPIVLAIERAKAQVKVYLVDFSKATNVWGTFKGDRLKYNKLGDYDTTVAALAKLGVKTAAKALVLDSGLTKKGTPLVEGWTATDKIEGVTIINGCSIALGSDNDFGYADDQSTLSVINLDKCLPDIYAEMQARQ